jgi:TolB-like protein
VFPVQGKLGIHADLAELVSDHVLQELRHRAAFGRVMSPTEITQLMPVNEQKTVLECASDECSLVDNELAGALGATHIVIGNVSRLGKSFQLTLKLFELKRGLVISTSSDRIAGESAEALLDGVKPCVVKLLMQAAMNKLPTAAVFPLARKLDTTPAVADQFTADLLAQVRRWPAFDVVMSPADIATRMTPEQQNVVTACAHDDCAVVDEDLVGGLGVTHVLLGSVAKGEQSHVVTVKLIQIKTGLVVSTLTQRVALKETSLASRGDASVEKMLVQARLMTEGATVVAPLTATEGGGRRWPIWTLAGGALGVGGFSAFIAVLAAVAGGGMLALNLLPDVNRPLVKPFGAEAKAVVLQAPLVALAGLTLATVVVTLASLAVGGGSALSAWLGARS